MPIKQIQQMGSSKIENHRNSHYPTEAVMKETREHIKLHIHLQQSKSLTSGKRYKFPRHYFYGAIVDWDTYHLNIVYTCCIWPLCRGYFVLHLYSHCHWALHKYLCWMMHAKLKWRKLPHISNVLHNITCIYFALWLYYFWNMLL